MSSKQPSLRNLVQQKRGQEDELLAHYFNAKMIQAGMPVVRFIGKVKADWGGLTARRVVELLEPEVYRINPRFVSQPDSIPTAIKAARVTGNAENRLLERQPQLVIEEHRQTVGAIELAEARALDELGKGQDRGGEIGPVIEVDRSGPQDRLGPQARGGNTSGIDLNQLSGPDSGGLNL